MNYVETRDQLAGIAQLVRRCPTITLTRALTKAYRDWAAQTQYLRVQILGAVEADVTQYALGSDPYVEIVAIFAMVGSITNGQGATQSWPITPGDSSLWSPNFPPQAPQRYTYVPQAQFAVYPTPDQAYDVNVTVIVQPKEQAANIPDTGLIKYRSGIEAGALAYLQSLPGQSWTNPNEALKNQREFQSSINNAKAEVQRGFNTGSVRTRPRAFIVGRRLV